MVKELICLTEDPSSIPDMLGIVFVLLVILILNIFAKEFVFHNNMLEQVSIS